MFVNVRALESKRLFMLIYRLLETNLIPDFIIRYGIRRMLAEKIRTETLPACEAQQAALMDFVAELKQSPIAIETDAANVQHYELPARFFQLCLGPRRKYSSAYWWEGNDTSSPAITTLARAEERMLALSCERADIQDGQHILDLGCGWGSLSLWLAEKYPNTRITGLSNSHSQKQFIDAEAKAKGFQNLEIVTANIAAFEGFADGRTFDRVISVEMFEHMKNYQQLLSRISGWMRPDARLFIHIFTHKRFAYHYEDTDGTDWLTRYFFTGGTMPSDDLLLYFQDNLKIEQHWQVNGEHYGKTANAWEANMRDNKAEILKILAATYGEKQTKRWWVYWKVFYLACAELWNYKNGEEWLVSHYRFIKP